MPTGYSEEELAGLTEAERAALDIEGEDPSRTLDDIGEAVDELEDALQSGDDDKANEALDKIGDAVKAKAADEDEVDIPLLDDTPPDGADEKLQQLSAQKAELRKKYDDGEISFDEYDSQKDDLSRQEREIERALDKANIAREMRERQATADWSRTVNGFLKEHPEYQVPADEAARATPEGRAAALRYSTLDQAVRRIARENPNMSGADILNAAHEELAGAFNLGKPATDKTPRSGRERAAAEAVPTLANLPAAENNGTDSRYARLDHLRDTNPVAYETELARLEKADPSAYEAYMRA